MGDRYDRPTEASQRPGAPNRLLQSPTAYVHGTTLPHCQWPRDWPCAQKSPTQHQDAPISISAGTLRLFPIGPQSPKFAKLSICVAFHTPRRPDLPSTTDPCPPHLSADAVFYPEVDDHVHGRYHLSQSAELGALICHVLPALKVFYSVGVSEYLEDVGSIDSR